MKHTIENAPDTIPAPPAPAIARPQMNMFELTAVAHNREPSSNKAKNPKNVHYDVLELRARMRERGHIGQGVTLRENVAKSLPLKGCSEHLGIEGL